MVAGSIAPTMQRVAGWVARLILILFIILTAETWLDVVVFQPEEYERLIGSEAACGKFASYCSWQAFILDSVPDGVLAVLAIVALAWRKVPRRELMLWVLTAAIFAYLAWRAYKTYVEAMTS